jgi:hypothetical protein
MEQENNIAQNKLEHSKAKLAKAFKALEEALETKLFNKVEDGLSDTEKTVLKANYDNLRNINVEMVKELTSSIKAIERILDTRDVNNQGDSKE